MINELRDLNSKQVEALRKFKTKVVTKRGDKVVRGLTSAIVHSLRRNKVIELCIYLRGTTKAKLTPLGDRLLKELLESETIKAEKVNDSEPIIYDPVMHHGIYR